MRKRNFSSKQKYWRRVLARQIKSGVSAKEFCVRQGIGLSSFYGWRRRLASVSELGDGDAATKGFSELIPVRIKPALSAIRVSMRSGVAVEFNEAPSLEWLANLIRLIA